MRIELEVLDDLTVHPHTKGWPVAQDSDLIPFSGFVDVGALWCDDRKHRTHRVGRGLFVHLMKQIDLHAALRRASVLRRVEVDPAVRPTLEKDLQRQIEVFE
jgi:hypothetical protein